VDTTKILVLKSRSLVDIEESELKFNEINMKRSKIPESVKYIFIGAFGMLLLIGVGYGVCSVIGESKHEQTVEDSDGRTNSQAEDSGEANLDTDSDEISTAEGEGLEANQNDDAAGKKTYATTISCTNPYTQEKQQRVISFESSSIDVENDISEIDCGLEVDKKNYTFKLKFIFEAAGYVISQESQIPEVTEINTPNLKVDFLDSYPRKKILRLTRYQEEGSYEYVSYFEKGEENCDQWQGRDAVLACGVGGITLDSCNIEVLCRVKNQTAVSSCDNIMNTLSIEEVK
jgi:hypothetical protein